MSWQWRRKNEPRRPGLTGSGNFIANIDGWFWDDAASPGLLSIDRFYDLRKLALAPEEHTRLSMVLTSDGVIFRGRKQTSSEDTKFAKYALHKVANYLLQIRKNDFKQLDYWLGFNVMLHDDGWVKDQNGMKINHDILRVVAAYINCLKHWGFEYDWSNIHDSSCVPAPLLYRHREPQFCLSQSEIEYVQGRTYQFSILTKRSTWHFDCANQGSEIHPRSGGELTNF